MKKTVIICISVMMTMMAAVSGCSKPADNPASSGERQTSTVSAKSLGEVYGEIKANVTLPEMVEIDSARKLDRYYGIDESDVQEYAGGINNSGVEQDEIVLMKATDEEAAKRIEEALQARYESKYSENVNYNPEQAAMIQSCKVERSGLYISMIISPDADEITKLYKNGIGM